MSTTSRMTGAVIKYKYFNKAGRLTTWTASQPETRQALLSAASRGTLLGARAATLMKGAGSFAGKANLGISVAIFLYDAETLGFHGAINESTFGISGAVESAGQSTYDQAIKDLSQTQFGQDLNAWLSGTGASWY